MRYAVEVAPSARADLERLFDFLLDRAATLEDLAQAQAAIDALRSALEQQLSTSPFSFRKAAQRPDQRELIIPSGRSGYVALYEIVGGSKVVVLAVRHQREEDYH